MNDAKIINCSEMILKAVNISLPQNNELPSVWKNVVSKIHSNYYESENSEKRMPIGERLAGNTRVVDLKNGILLIETDHSGWIQYLKFYQKFIITGLKRALPDLKINSLAFRIAGSEALLHEMNKKIETDAINEMKQKIEENEKKIDEYYANNNSEKNQNSENVEITENNEKNSNLPPELLEKFESLKKSMLTNSQK